MENRETVSMKHLHDPAAKHIIFSTVTSRGRRWSTRWPSDARPPGLCVSISLHLPVFPACSVHRGPPSTCAWFHAKDLSVPTKSECIPGICKYPSQRLDESVRSSYFLIPSFTMSHSRVPMATKFCRVELHKPAPTSCSITVPPSGR